MIALNKISKYYPLENNQIVAGIKDITAEFSVGEFVAIAGPSGSGKSTLLNILAGTDYYNEGNMAVNGEETEYFDENDWQKYRKELISFIYQDYNLIENLNVYQNVELAYDLNNDKQKSKKKQEIEKLLNDVGLISQAKQKVSTLSGGQKQRTAIARALAKNTPIILADEPTGNLDSTSAKEVIDLLKKISENKLVIVVTHSIADFEKHITRKIYLDDGRISCDKQTTKDIPPVQAITKIESAGAKKPVVNLLKNELKYSGKSGRLLCFTVITVILLIFLFFSSLLELNKPYTNGYNNVPVFGSVSPDKLIIIKKDNSPFSEADLNKIKSNRHISYVYSSDIISSMVLKITFRIDENHNAVLHYYPKVITGGLQLTAGRMPSEKNETILATEGGLPVNAQDELLAVDFIGSDYKSEHIKIVGFVKASETMRPNIYFTEEMASELNKKYLDRYSDIVFVNSENEIYIKNNLTFIIDDRIADKQFFVSDSMRASLSADSVLYEIKIRNNLFERGISDCSVLKISDADASIKASYSSLAETSPMLIFNTAMLNTLITDDIYQLSAFLKAPSDYEVAVNILESDYYVYYPNAINIIDKDAELIARTFSTSLISIVIAVVLLPLSLMLIKRIYYYKPQNNAVLLSLGYREKTINQSNFWEIVIFVLFAAVINIIFIFIAEIVYNMQSDPLKKVFIPLSNITFYPALFILTLTIGFYLFFASKICNKKRELSINQTLKKGGV